MSGHASKDEMKIVEQLESAIDLKTSPIDDLLELGQLYIEPCHREAEAILIFETILMRNPHNNAAKFWLAYCCLHYLMDPKALQRAVSLLETNINANDDYAGASYAMLAEIFEEQNSSSHEKKIQMLEASVIKEPSWVYNRQSLAWAYIEVGRFADAFEQIQIALTNVQEPDPGWNITKRNFEESITGRTGYRAIERLQSDLEKIKTELEKTKK
ncbi:MAG: hypothetical protein L0226_05810 [Acidobacteria bacterium]|nr:hypothetical protein [Acidobacteriota bacterium]